MFHHLPVLQAECLAAQTVSSMFYPTVGSISRALTGLPFTQVRKRPAPPCIAFPAEEVLDSTSQPALPTAASQATERRPSSTNSVRTTTFHPTLGSHKRRRVPEQSELHRIRTRRSRSAAESMPVTAGASSGFASRLPEHTITTTPAAPFTFEFALNVPGAMPSSSTERSVDAISHNASVAGIPPPPQLLPLPSSDTWQPRQSFMRTSGAIDNVVHNTVIQRPLSAVDASNEGTSTSPFTGTDARDPVEGASLHEEGRWPLRRALRSPRTPVVSEAGRSVGFSGIAHEKYDVHPSNSHCSHVPHLASLLGEPGNDIAIHPGQTLPYRLTGGLQAASIQSSPVSNPATTRAPPTPSSSELRAQNTAGGNDASQEEHLSNWVSTRRYRCDKMHFMCLMN